MVGKVYSRNTSCAVKLWREEARYSMGKEEVVKSFKSYSEQGRYAFVVEADVLL